MVGTGQDPQTRAQLQDIFPGAFLAIRDAVQDISVPTEARIWSICSRMSTVCAPL